MAPATPATFVSDPYGLHDPIPVPHAVERYSDTSWALWTEMQAQHEAMFAKTVPCTIPAPCSDEACDEPAVQAIRPRPMPFNLNVEAVLAETRRNARVCPRPQPWQELFDMLPCKVRTTVGWMPSPPLDAYACIVLPTLPKRLCLREHIEWAAAQGCLKEVHDFLSNLAESDWYHLGD